MTDNLGIWSGDFGKEYTDRNQYDPLTRVDGFRTMIPDDAHYILEIGSNYGNNLAALEALGKTAIGVEPNKYARRRGQELDRCIVPGDSYHIPFADNSFDLVLTCGLLIHIPPDKLKEAMQEIARVSRKYILTIEYEGKDSMAGVDGMKIYRGQRDLLWKRQAYSWPQTVLLERNELDAVWDNAISSLHRKV